MSQTALRNRLLKPHIRQRMILDEDAWLGALISRNNVSHAYHGAVALDIINKTKTVYYRMFCNLKKRDREELDLNDARGVRRGFLRCRN